MRIASGTCRRLQQVIVHRPAHAYADMRNGSPALEGVVASAVEQVGYADGGRGSGKFNANKERAIIDSGVVQQPFVVALIAQVTRGSVVQHACPGDAGE